MDETIPEFIRKTILKISMSEMMTVLKPWNFLSENQLQVLNFQQRKESFAPSVVLLCEKCAGLSHVALLDIICTQVLQHQKI
uniref:Uncharacterized protein n=1 Tax=Oryctolagus cuniculus TaxID=9986 RepID=A0A5F9DAV0_RABIT